MVESEILMGFGVSTLLKIGASPFAKIVALGAKAKTPALIGMLYKFSPNDPLVTENIREYKKFWSDIWSNVTNVASSTKNGDILSPVLVSDLKRRNNPLS